MSLAWGTSTLVRLQAAARTQLNARAVAEALLAADRSPSADALARRLADPAAAAALLLAPLAPGARVLELNVGRWNNLAPLAVRLGARVWVADRSPERLEVQRALVGACGDAVELVHVRDVARLPFEAANFDLVLLHGALAADATLPPLSQRERRLLAGEVCRVLKPGGQVSLTGLNRWSPTVLRGATRVVPQPRGAPSSRSPGEGVGRPPAGQSSDDVVPPDEGSAPLGLSGYRRWLANGGLAPCELHVAHPSDDLPAYLLPYALGELPAAIWAEVCREQFAPLNRAGFTQRLKGVAAAAARWQLGRRFAAAFVIRAAATGAVVAKRPALVERIVAQAAGPDARPVMLLVRLTHAVIVPSVRLSDQSLVYVKLPLDDYGQESLKRHWKWIAAPAQGALPAAAQIAPRPVSQGAVDGQPYYAEESLGGRGGGRAKAPLELLERRALEALTALHVATRSQAADAAVQRWQRRIERLAEHSLVADRRRFEAAARRAAEACRQLPLAVAAHNDFHLGNVVFDETGAVRGVLDWDLADRSGLPATDAIQLLLSSRLRRDRRRKADVLADLAAGRFPAQHAAFERYAQAVGVRGEIACWLPLYVVTQVWRLSIQAGYWLCGSSFERRMRDEADSLLQLAAG